jgi:3-deoxy-D-manno-octulosonic-acid transferase
MYILYCLGIYLFEALCFIACPFNKKIKTMVKGQKQCYNVLRKIKKDDKIAWFHCSSLGEFEQARNLIENFKKDYPNYKILVSFFSPSGYEIRKNYPFADFIVYLPFDSRRKARKFIRLAHPNIVFFIKYEFWYNYIKAMKNIPLFQVSLILREKHYLLSWYGGWFCKQLKHFNYFFVQDENTKNILERIGYKNSIISGDTRFDRVFAMKNEDKRFPMIEKFCQDKNIFIAGSSWKEDEILIQQAMQGTDMKIILAPHIIDKSHIDFILSLFPDALLYSQITEENITKANILIIDCIGILAYLYRYAFVSYIGGGFGVGIHNILEAAIFAEPVCFGTNYKNFKEAVDLVDLGGAKVIDNSQTLKNYINNLEENKDLFCKIKEINKNYAEKNIGATTKILSMTKNYIQ